MTDREKLLEMLQRNNITYELEGDTVIVKGGYIEFFTVFEFTEDGNLKSIGAYE